MLGLFSYAYYPFVYHLWLKCSYLLLISLLSCLFLLSCRVFFFKYPGCKFIFRYMNRWVWGFVLSSKSVQPKPKLLVFRALPAQPGGRRDWKQAQAACHKLTRFSTKLHEFFINKCFSMFFAFSQFPKLWNGRFDNFVQSLYCFLRRGFADLLFYRHWKSAVGPEFFYIENVAFYNNLLIFLGIIVIYV